MSAACPTFGFEGWFETQLLDEAQRCALWQAFASEVLELRGLHGQCLSHGGTIAFAVSSDAGQATDADRSAVDAWARARAEVRAVRLGPLVDLADVA